MTIKDLRKLTIEELRDKISELKEELISLEFKARTAQESDTSSLGKMKKDIARAFTILNEKLAEGDIAKVGNVLESEANLDITHPRQARSTSSGQAKRAVPAGRQDPGSKVKSDSDK